MIENSIARRVSAVIYFIFNVWLVVAVVSYITTTVVQPSMRGDLLSFVLLLVEAIKFFITHVILILLFRYRRKRQRLLEWLTLMNGALYLIIALASTPFWVDEGESVWVYASVATLLTGIYVVFWLLMRQWRPRHEKTPTVTDSESA